MTGGPRTSERGLSRCVFLSLGLVVIALSACSSTESAPAAPTSRFRSAFVGLCQARQQAGDAASARATFFDESHQALHELAIELEGTDRGDAARLLEAKARVEVALDRPSTSSLRQEVLDDLIEVTRSGLRSLSIEMSCPKS